MKQTTIKFKGNEYSITTGQVFQAEVRNGIVGTIFVVQTNPDEKVYLELLEKLSSNISLLRVNEIQWGQGDNVNVENFNDIVIEGDSKSIILDNLTKKELVEFIKSNNLDINTKLKKQDLIEAIKNSV